MQFVRVAQLDDCVEPLRARLSSELEQGRRVVWLVPGGSNVPLAVNVMQSLPPELTRGLAILLTDERYGDIGHADSNMQQLLDAGFNPKQAILIPTLVEGLDLEVTRTRYAEAFMAARDNADVMIGQFGMGTDGHIAGILPDSPAATSSELACAYQAGEYTRLTLTFAALASLQTAYVCAFGDNKREALTRLETERPPTEQPAQFIKELPEAYVYNDQIGEQS